MEEMSEVLLGGTNACFGWVLTSQGLAIGHDL